MLAGGTWLSPKEIADLGLPGMPADKRKVADLIASERWATRVGTDGRALHRARKGRGGGFEWHSSLLPERARQELVRRGVIAAPVCSTTNVVALPIEPSAAWAAFERLAAGPRAEAERRLAVINAVEAHVATGTTKTRGIALAAADAGVSVATVNGWFSRVAGVARHDRLPNLAPDTKGGGKKAEIATELWDLYRSDWLRFEQPTHASCYWRIQRAAAARGIADIPSAKTFQRKLEKETPPEVILARREGRERVAQIIPAQIRDTSHMHALHTVNIDGHVWDVRVLWPDGHVERPTMIGIQDVYSNMLLSWRVDISETAVLTRLAFADLFKNYGIPRYCLMDNGRAFASGWISGGTKTRYRFKYREDEPLGLLASLGIENRFATPYHGQAKPIERAWRDLCDYIARGPDFAGAYTGNSPAAKPENYGERAIPLADFERVIAREIKALNAKMGRRGRGMMGRSFEQTFNTSVAEGAPIGRATDAQMRLALLAAERVFSDRKTGAINFLGNRYWADGMHHHAGTRLTIRFDPDNLHSSVFAYDATGALIGELPIWEASGFDDVAAAKRQAKLVGDHRKAVKATVAAERLLEAEEVARALSDLGTPDSDMPEPVVLRPVRAGRGRQATAAAAQADDFMDRFAGGMAALDRTSPGLRLVE